MQHNRISFLLYLCVFFLLLLTPMQVSADLGPKPSVVVEFEGLEEEEYYVTLLAETDSTGPWSEGNEFHDYMGEEAVFQKFCEYEDVEGYHFLSFMEECSEDDTFEWTYYPPSKFKILIYFPEYDDFWISEEIYERYAFDSYFSVTVSGGEPEIGETEEGKPENGEPVLGEHMSVEKSYDFSMELISLVVRVIITIAIEILVALPFAYRDKKSLVIITVTNVITQVVLNILLNIINYRSGQAAFLLNYIWMECVIFVIEGFVYDKLIGRINLHTNKEYHPYWYAAIANIVSVVAGIWIARVIPGIF